MSLKKVDPKNLIQITNKHKRIVKIICGKQRSNKNELIQHNKNKNSKTI